MKILDQKQEAILEEIRQITGDLEKTLATYGASVEDQNELALSSRQIDDLFLLVVVGEFNSGKSAFINALLGKKLLEEGVTPTTTKVNLLRYGKSQERSTIDKNLYLVSAPIKILSDISIVDTPGTNTIIREHETITVNFVPRSDFVLFVTSADRPFTDSEKNFLKSIKDWGKKVIIILNKIDILEDVNDIDRIVNFISGNINALLKITPEVFPVSAKYALSGKNGNQDHWKLSRFEELENYINNHLDDTTKIKLKFSNPLGIVNNLSKKYDSIFQDRLALLKDDIELINNIDKQISLYKDDLNRDFQFRIKDIENILIEMEQRGRDFFNDTLRFLNIFGLLKKDEIQKSFERIVMSDVPSQIEQKILELIDWMVEQEFRQWETMLTLISNRQKNYPENKFNDPGSAALNYDRKRLIKDLNDRARNIVNTYDRKKEAKIIADKAQEAVAATAALGVGAVGIGTLITTLTTTMAIDVTGVILAGTLAILGIVVIPSRRRKVNKELSIKLRTLRKKLSVTLFDQFSKEIVNSQNNLTNAFMPYAKFVKAENENLKSSLDKLTSIQTRTIQLLDKIDTL